MNDIRCPHCGKKLTGMARIALKTALESDEVVGSSHTCPSCGKEIYKKDIVESQSQK